MSPVGGVDPSVAAYPPVGTASSAVDSGCGVVVMAWDVVGEEEAGDEISPLTEWYPGQMVVEAGVQVTHHIRLQLGEGQLALIAHIALHLLHLELDSLVDSLVLATPTTPQP
jgi:hypothetical protein